MKPYHYELVNKAVIFLETNWAEIVKAIVSVWVAWVATVALTTWKRQSKAQKQTDFLDQITESVHEFINLLRAPTDMVGFVKIGIESYVGIHKVDKSLKNPEAIAYIEKRGERDAKQLNEFLKPCTEPLSRIRFLVTKGHVFGFRNYTECQNACAMITWQYDRIAALSYLIGSSSLNWENPKVQKTLSDVIALDPDDIDKQVKEQRLKFLTFVRDNYQTIFK